MTRHIVEAADLAADAHTETREKRWEPSLVSKKPRFELRRLCCAPLNKPAERRTGRTFYSFRSGSKVCVRSQGSRDA